MADGKTKIIFYQDWRDVFDTLSDEEAGRLIKHFFAYVSDENPTPPDRVTELSFIGIKSQLKRDLKKWEAYRQKQSENGSKGGRPKSQKSQPFISKAKKAVEVEVEVEVEEEDSINNNIPSLEEFLLHAESKKPDVDLEEVRLKYETWVDNDWRDGYDKPILRWKPKLTNTLKYLPVKTKEKKFKFDQSKSKHI
jgi:hypothetical protein